MLIGYDIGGTKSTVILGDFELNIIAKETFSTLPQNGFDDFLARLINVSSKILKNNAIDAIGVSIGGPLDSNKGIIFNPPHLGWGVIPLKDILRKQFNCPVKIEHDAKACALVEWRFGAGEGSSNMIFLTLGTGLGAGLILEEKLYRGSNGFAGEVGHIRVSNEGPIVYGKKGSWESFCSGRGIGKLAHEMFPEIYPENTDAKEVCERAIKGEEEALIILKKSGRYLGIGLSILIDIFNPDTIVLGSLSWRFPEIWLNEALRVVEEEALELARKHCRIVLSRFKENLGDLAALFCAKIALEESS